MNTQNYIITVALFAILLGGLSVLADQPNIVLSTKGDAVLGGLSFRDGDLADYDPGTDIATLLFNENLFGGDEDIGAVHIFDNGHVILSPETDAYLGGLAFEDGDLVEYDPINNTSTLFFDEDLFTGNEDIDAACVLGNGHIVLSTEADATLGGLSFEDGDLVDYDPVHDTATLLFDQDLFLEDEDIDAVQIFYDGHIVLSTTSDATLADLSFEDGDLIRYDPVNQEATLYFDEDLFSGDEDISAIFIPEPAMLSLLALGGLLVTRRRR